jgi:hypothetical protein
VLVHQCSLTCALFVVLHASVECTVYHKAYACIAGQMFQTAFCILSFQFSIVTGSVGT